MRLIVKYKTTAQFGQFGPGHPNILTVAGFSNCINIYQNWLVVLTILKNMKVNGKDYPIYYGK